MPGGRCVVPLCNSDENVPYRGFPKNSAVGKLWVQAVNNPLLFELSYEQIYKKRYCVCRKHFSEECILFTGRTPLSREAVPTLHLPPRDNENIETAEKVIDAASMNAEAGPSIQLMSQNVSPIRYTRSPSTRGIRRSSLHTPNTTPTKSISFSTPRKRSVANEEEAESSFVPRKLSRRATVSDIDEIVHMFDLSKAKKFEESTATIADLVALESCVLDSRKDQNIEAASLLEEPANGTSASVIVESSLLHTANEKSTKQESTRFEKSTSGSSAPTIVESSLLRTANEKATEQGSTRFEESTSGSSAHTKVESSLLLNRERSYLQATAFECLIEKADAATNSSIPVLSCKSSRDVVKARTQRRKPPQKESLQKLSVALKGWRVVADAVKLQKELSRCKKQLRRKKNDREKKCMELCQKFKNLSSTQQTLVRMQLNNVLKDKGARRFSEEEKNLALSIYKRSPACYRFLTDIFVLPSISTIKRNLGRIELDTGINTNISQLLKDCASKMTNEKEKVVILMWDETFLKSELHYDYQKDKFVGFEDFGRRCTSAFANEILVFMIRGLWSNTKLPISYYFANGQTKSGDLLAAVKQNIKMVQDAGFKVVATVCDGGSSNNKVLNDLRQDYVGSCAAKRVEADPRYGVIEMGGQKICLMHDTVHLFKCLRNLLLKHLLEIDYPAAESRGEVDRKFVKWDYYEKPFDMDVNSRLYLRHIPKVTETHVRQHKIKKMKVSHCCQVFSRSMADWLLVCVGAKAYTTSEGTFEMPEEAKHTAEFTFFADQLFDSCNSRKTKKAALDVHKPLLQVVKDGSPHFDFWKEAVERLQNMRFRDLDKAHLPQANESRHRFIRTIRMMPDLWNVLKAKDFPYLKTGYINQDPLENFFGNLKAHGARNVSPSCFQAESNLKALMVSSLSAKNSIGANCLDDEGTTMATLQTFASITNKNTENCGQRCHEFDEVPFREQKKTEKWSPITAAKRIISAGNFAKVVLSNIKGIKSCKTCFEVFFSAKQNDNIAILKQANFETKKPIAHADYFERGFTRGVNHLEQKLPSLAWEANLRQTLKDEIKKILDFEWVTCPNHKDLIKHHFLETLVLNCITEWSIHINSILHGQKRISQCNMIERIARDHYLKGIKRTSGMEKQRNPAPRETDDSKEKGTATATQKSTETQKATTTQKAKATNRKRKK